VSLDSYSKKRLPTFFIAVLPVLLASGACSSGPGSSDIAPAAEEVSASVEAAPAEGASPALEIPAIAGRRLTGDYLGQDPPGRIPEVFAPGIISHGFHEHHLTINPDGDEMFYATSSSDHQVYVIARVWRENGIWHGPEIASFSGRYMDMGPAFSPDGQELYFTSRRPPAGGMEENIDFDIWMTQRVGGAWSEPVNLGGTVNTDRNEIFPSVASNGTIYFQYYEESGSESDFYTSRLVDGEYQTPVRIEYGISTEHYESHPAVAPDESHLIFQSIRPGGFGGVDFYISFRHDDGYWSEPANLGEAVSASDNVISPMLSPDGRYFFFSRNGPAESFSLPAGSYDELLRRLRGPENGYGCLYWVDASVIFEQHPELRR